MFLNPFRFRKVRPTVTFKIWGAAGGGGQRGGIGGPGGYTTYTDAFEPGTSFTLLVGGGGRSNGAGGGGGFSGVFTGPPSQASALALAGGGGGGGDPTNAHGGAGGGTSGSAGVGARSGGGGTQSSGGAGNGSGTPGGALQGGEGGTWSGTGSGGDNTGGGNTAGYGGGGDGGVSGWPGGAGGGGYFGGGGGDMQGGDTGTGGGGGGSSYVADPAKGSTVAGSGTTPGNSGDADRSGAGQGVANATGAHGRIVVYVNGVLHSTFTYTGALQTFTVPTVASSSGDPYAAYLKFALFGKGANGTTPASSDIGGKSLTWAGASISTAQSLNYTSSIGFYGGQWITVPDSNDWSFEGNFTIRFKLYVNSLGSAPIGLLQHKGGNPNYGWQITTDSGGYVQTIFWYNNGANAATITSAGGVITAGQWYDIEVSRDGTTLRLFVNGVLRGTETLPGAVRNVAEGLTIGRNVETNVWHLNGYLQDILIYNGVALHTSNFTPPSTGYADTYST